MIEFCMRALLLCRAIIQRWPNRCCS